jgi:hypothetical protein
MKAYKHRMNPLISLGVGLCLGSSLRLLDSVKEKLVCTGLIGSVLVLIGHLYPAIRALKRRSHGL